MSQTRFGVTSRALKFAALGGLLSTTFEAVHGLADQWCQLSRDAVLKGLHGTTRVRLDGTVATEADIADPHVRTVKAGTLGWLCAARHGLTYSGVQLTAGVAVTRALGYRLPARAWLAGTAITLVTHTVIDRRRPLTAVARCLGKGGYLETATVVRTPGEAPDHGGPGTALFELDQAAHRALGVLAAVVTAVVARRGDR
ncbi:hypothetical protein F7Q99_36775 [Streptomyces kaniharaensis]|uniref:Uncharacterized protein n=1 Tax=Streptomyces kaniharaensis TaxID=212423 RepID=A0A6N7L0U2_9ACTN|nr:hypothetical protein [Streptomyces kaniharaensis]MQS17596.1 hypothetical protein [Streptomyces kaniharaensis]